MRSGLHIFRQGQNLRVLTACVQDPSGHLYSCDLMPATGTLHWVRCTIAILGCHACYPDMFPEVAPNHQKRHRILENLPILILTASSTSQDGRVYLQKFHPGNTLAVPYHHLETHLGMSGSQAQQAFTGQQGPVQLAVSVCTQVTFRQPHK